MALSRKIILHSPVSDDALLEDFVERCLSDGVSLLAIVGPGAPDLEDTIDWLVVRDGSDKSRFLCTTSHPGEGIEDVIPMVQAWEAELGGEVQEIRL